MDSILNIPIGLTGLNAVGGSAGVGKDTLAEIIISKRPAEFVRYGLADPIREIVKVFGFTDCQLTDRRLKEHLDPFWGISPRRLLQIIGTDMFRDVWRKDVWIECARKVIMIDNPDRHVIISDVRYANEVDFIKRLGGIIVRIKRDCLMEDVVEAHPSELELNQMFQAGEISADLMIDNNGPIEDLEQAAFKVLELVTIKQNKRRTT